MTSLVNAYVIYVAELALVRIGTLVVQGNMTAAVIWAQRIDLIPASDRVRIYMQTYISYIIQNPATDWAKRNLAQVIQEILLK
ncbi:hypothetical protein GmRootA79_03970 [Acidovorax sp. A79]|uniref:hypothetical protein n=1 Tax=Acidovorax sp. A79 TaxID=3056107 RepID=UPI0034E8BA75